MPIIQPTLFPVLVGANSGVGTVGAPAEVTSLPPPLGVEGAEGAFRGAELVDSVMTLRSLWNGPNRIAHAD
jgi:hypothetical protein